MTIKSWGRARLRFVRIRSPTLTIITALKRTIRTLFTVGVGTARSKVFNPLIKVSRTVTTVV